MRFPSSLPYRTPSVVRVVPKKAWMPFSAAPLARSFRRDEQSRRATRTKILVPTPFREDGRLSENHDAFRRSFAPPLRSKITLRL